MRNLKNTDLFKVMRIMRKANIKQNLINMKLPKDVSENEYGTMLIFEVIESAPDAEKEIFSFLADIGGVEQEALENDEFELLPGIIEHLTKQEKFIVFLKQAFKSMN